ncbi:hypothetical protein, partial [Polaromonas sp.]|uniref:hypothetical protein n=1 Tax=Polaromonas sp. TaxID=1869339 RepID=UPI0025FE144B
MLTTPANLFQENTVVSAISARAMRTDNLASVQIRMTVQRGSTTFSHRFGETATKRQTEQCRKPERRK